MERYEKSIAILREKYKDNIRDLYFICKIGNIVKRRHYCKINSDFIDNRNRAIRDAVYNVKLKEESCLILENYILEDICLLVSKYII
jgi:hypothetical protein